MVIGGEPRTILVQSMQSARLSVHSSELAPLTRKRVLLPPTHFGSKGADTLAGGGGEGVRDLTV
jgi:hypothetical protein